MERDTVLILDFGSQYTQLIARRLRELQVYSEILPRSTKAKALADRRPKGIVLSGGPDSVHERGAPRCDRRVFELGVPVVGICYGMQLMSHMLGGEVQRSGRREYGQATFLPATEGTLFRGLSARSRVWMSHGDDIRRAPGGFLVVCSCRRDWNAASFVGEAVSRIRGQVGKGRVICALSGGVDSAVAALLAHRAGGGRL